jgi:SHS2 domain-containing protein/predicted kinase
VDSVSSQSAGGKQARSQSRACAVSAAVATVEKSLPPATHTASPALVVFSGVPGSGKSYLARRVQPRLAAAIIETDYVRRLLFAMPCYSAQENAWVYTVCHALIAGRLAQGQTVVFDATNLLESGRRRLYAIARNAGARLVIVHTTAPDTVIRQRIAQRSQERDPGNHSEAGIAVYEALRQTEQPIRHAHIVIDTTQDVAKAIQRILSECAMTASDSAQSFAVLDHTADLAVRVWGRTLEELFANAAVAMFSQMGQCQATVAVQRDVSVEGDDNESLLVAWLSELLYLREVNGEAYHRFTVHFPAPGRLTAQAGGGVWSSFDRPIKAVTFHNLKITRCDGRYETTIVFDV